MDSSKPGITQVALLDYGRFVTIVAARFGLAEFFQVAGSPLGEGRLEAGRDVASFQRILHVYGSSQKKRNIAIGLGF